MGLAIAHVLLSLRVGGLERLVVQMAAHLRRAGHRVLLVTLEDPPDGPLEGDFLAAGAEVHRVKKRPGGYDVTLPPRLFRLFRRERIDVVHTHNSSPLIYAALPGRLSGATVVHSKHGPHPDKPLRLMIRRGAALAVHHFVVVSQATADFTRGLAEVADRKLQVIPNGIDLGAFTPDLRARAEVRAELGIPEEAWVVGTVGRLVGVKNHALLLEAAGPLLGERWHLVIAGDGPEADRTRNRAAALPGARFVHLTGHRADAARVVAALDAFVLSSDVEGLPLGLLEAMATGLPAVCTAVGGVPSVLEEGATGYLVPPKHPEALRRRLADLAADRERAARMGARARELAHARYGLERMMSAYLELYQHRPS